MREGGALDYEDVADHTRRIRERQIYTDVNAALAELTASSDDKSGASLD